MSKKVAVYGYIDNIFVEICDKCGEQSRASHTDWKELNKSNRAQGWVIRQEKGKYKGYCPKCIRGSDNAYKT